MEDFVMKASIDQDGCISCGLCADTCPSVFRMSDNGYAEVYVDSVPDEDKENAKDATDGCPVSVISLED
jgi:ferredoxin